MDILKLFNGIVFKSVGKVAAIVKDFGGSAEARRKPASLVAHGE